MALVTRKPISKATSRSSSSSRALKPLSLRAYAKRRGVSAEAVSKAVGAGRLHDAVIHVDGQPKIADVELADREWEANTRPRVDQPPAAAAPPRKAERRTEGVAIGADVPDYFVSRALREAAAARREAAQADLAEIDVAERRGELVPVAEARADVIDKFTVVKTRILGVPSRLAQRLPHLANDVVPIADELLREALEELAAEDPEDDGSGKDDADDGEEE